MLTARTARDDFSRAELLRAAWMAGNGCSAGEIAAALKTTPTGVYRLARQHGFAIVQRAEDEMIVNAPILRRHLDQIGVIAARKEVDPHNFLSDILRAVLSDEILTKEITDKIEVKPAKGKARGA